MPATTLPLSHRGATACLILDLIEWHSFLTLENARGRGKGAGAAAAAASLRDVVFGDVAAVMADASRSGSTTSAAGS